MCRRSRILAEAINHRENTFHRKDYLPRRQMLYVSVNFFSRRSGILAEATNLVPPRRPKRRRHIQNISPTRPRISPTRPKYVADASKDFADASKIFRRRVQGFRRRVQRFHRRRGNAAEATSYLLSNKDCMDTVLNKNFPLVPNVCI